MEKRKMKKTVLLGLAMFAVMTLGEVYGGNTYTVYNSMELYNIQHGIGYPPLQDGDTIRLAPNTYTSYTISPWYAPIDPPAGKHITYIGSGIGATILYGGLVSEFETGYWPCINLDPGDSADVCDLTVLCGYDEYNVNCDVICQIQMCGFGDGSIVCKGGASLVMRDCLVTGGNAPACYCPPDNTYNDKWVDTSGIYCENSSLLIEDCNISIARLVRETGDLNVSKPAIKIKGISSNVTIRDSNISNNTPRDANEPLVATISMENGESLTLEHCIFSGNKGPCVEYATPDNTGDATITNCTIDGKGEYSGLILRNFGDVTITGCTIKNCHSWYSGGSVGPGILIADWPVNVEIDDCNFTDNITTTGVGGAIMIYYCGSATINNCTITGNKAHGGGGIFLYSNAKNVTISNCTISGNEASRYGGGYGGGIGNYALLTTTTVTHCIITENKALQEGAVGGGIISDGDINIINCMITKNEADREHGGEGGGIYVDTSFSNPEVKIINSTVADNNAFLYGGAMLAGSDVNVDNCIFWGNRGNTPEPEVNKWQIRNISYYYTNISHCDIEHSKSVLYDLGYGDGPKDYIVDLNFDLPPYSPTWPDKSRILGNDLSYNLPPPDDERDPLLTSDYHLTSGSTCIDGGENSVVTWPYDIDGQTRIIGLFVDIGADEYVVEIPPPQDRVHNITQDKWYHYIQPAINEAIGGDEIVAYPSIYYENIDFMGKAITVRSTNPDDWGTVEATIIDGSGNYTVQFLGNEGPDTILKGFTIRHGYSGVLCYFSHPTISNCIIEDNPFCGIDYTCSPYAPTPPDGLIIKNNIIRNNNVHGIMADSTCTITGNQIYDNSNMGIYSYHIKGAIKANYIHGNNKGIYARDNTTAPIENNYIYGNTFGIYAEQGATVTIKGNEIYENGDGIFGDRYINATITNNKIHNNYEGMRIFEYSTVTVQNNFIYRNGYGIDVVFSSVTISNNTVVSNTIAGIACFPEEIATPYNCIIWNNYEDSYYEATYSCIEHCEDAGGIGNICGDANNPRFINADANNYHLSENSPCINVGDPDNNKYRGQTDIDGEPRVLMGRVDMGADETCYVAPDTPLQPNEPNEPPIYPDAHWWKLDEVNGITAYDSVSTNNGVFNGNDPCWTGGAVDLNGVNDYFSVSSLNSAYNQNSVFTVAGWFKTDQSTGIQTIVGQWSQDWEAGQEYYGWQVLVYNNKVVARFGEELYIHDITGTTDVNVGEWYHFAMVRNGTNVLLYVDGQPKGSGTANFYIYNTKFRIGDGSYAYGYPPPLKGGPFNGTIDDVMIFNRALTAEEVEQLYESGL